MKYQAEYSIGYQFKHYAKRHEGPRTIVDIHTTKDAAGEVVRVEYVTITDSCGRSIRDCVPLATVARSEPAK